MQFRIHFIRIRGSTSGKCWSRFASISNLKSEKNSNIFLLNFFCKRYISQNYVIFCHLWACYSFILNKENISLKKHWLNVLCVGLNIETALKCCTFAMIGWLWIVWIVLLGLLLLPKWCLRQPYAHNRLPRRMNSWRSGQTDLYSFYTLFHI